MQHLRSSVNQRFVPTLLKRTIKNALIVRLNRNERRILIFVRHWWILIEAKNERIKRRDEDKWKSIDAILPSFSPRSISFEGNDRAPTFARNEAVNAEKPGGEKKRGKTIVLHGRPSEHYGLETKRRQREKGRALLKLHRNVFVGTTDWKVRHRIGRGSVNIFPEKSFSSQKKLDDL